MFGSSPGTGPPILSVRSDLVCVCFVLRPIIFSNVSNENFPSDSIDFSMLVRSELVSLFSTSNSLSGFSSGKTASLPSSPTTAGVALFTIPPSANGHRFFTNSMPSETVLAAPSKSSLPLSIAEPAKSPAISAAL